MRCIICVPERKEGKPLLFKQTLIKITFHTITSFRVLFGLLKRKLSIGRCKLVVLTMILKNWNAMKHWLAETLFKFTQNYSRTGLATVNHKRPLRFFSRAGGSCTQARSKRKKIQMCARNGAYNYQLP